MKIKRHHFYTLLLTISMMLIALALLFMNEWLSKKVDPEVAVREVHLVSLPPQPPLPAQPREAPQQKITLSLEGDGPIMDISLIKIVQPKMQLTPPPIAMQMNVDFSDTLNIDWQAFGLDELDSIPRLLTRAKTAYPKALVKQGVLQTTVKLDVYIDETGRAKLLGVHGQHQKVLTFAISELIKRARFSPPTKDGNQVAARFVWPVEFKKS